MIGRLFWRRLHRPPARPAAAVDPEKVTAALRAARPEPPDLAQEAGDRMLAAVLADVNGRRAPFGPSIRFAGLALAACTVFSLVAVPLFLKHGRPNREHSEQVVRSNSPRMPKTGPANDGRPVNPARYAAKPGRRPSIELRARRYAGDTGIFASFRKRRQIAYRATVSHGLRSPKGLAAFVKSESVRPDDHGEGFSRPERLALIMTGPSEPALKVKLEISDEGHDGFASVTSFLPVGAGGGVLTRSTVRDNGGRDDVITASYGISYGQPVTRLAADSESAAAEPAKDERGLKP